MQRLYFSCIGMLDTLFTLKQQHWPFSQLVPVLYELERIFTQFLIVCSLFLLIYFEVPNKQRGKNWRAEKRAHGYFEEKALWLCFWVKWRITEVYYCSWFFSSDYWHSITLLLTWLPLRIVLLDALIMGMLQ